MEKTQEKVFEKNKFQKRLKSMLKVDFRRTFTTPLFYILVGISLVVPVLILVMTTMLTGEKIDPVTGEVTVVEGFKNVWQIIGTLGGNAANARAASAGESAAGMDMTAMCNVNLMYFAVAVLVCLFTAEDFRSGYAKNLFTVRAKKTEYVASKTIVCTLGGMCMIAAFFVGAMLGGVFAGLSFALDGTSVQGVLCCLAAKLLLVAVFVPIYLTMSVVAKQRVWLSILLSVGVGMFLFMMIPIVSPLDATLLHVVLSAAGGATFGFGLGAVSNAVLQKTSLV